MMIASEAVTVWWAEGEPSRIVWQGRRWRVTDQPTRLTGTPEFLPAPLTHAPERTFGWRFQASADDGAVLVVDVVRDGDAWNVVRVWN
jgi:hypothetical protein